jgi:hypothetical protein
MSENSKFEMKDDQVLIFKNEKRNKETQPEYTGKINIDGQIREISLWVKISKSGKKYFSGTHQEQRIQRTIEGLPYKAIPNGQIETEQENEDLPF